MAKPAFGPDDQIEIDNGVFKNVGECGPDDLEGVARINREKARLASRIAELMGAIAAGMGAQHKAGVAVEPALGKRMRAFDPDAPLAEIRQLAEDLEAASLSLFDEARGPQEGDDQVA